jgi:hypothetical protein
MIPVLAVIQGHPEAPRLWAKYVDKIIRKLVLKPAVHESCLHYGMQKRSRVLLKCQVNDFEVAAESPRVADIVFNKIDGYLTFPLERMERVAMINGIDVVQTRDYFKCVVETYIERVCKKHMMI